MFLPVGSGAGSFGSRHALRVALPLLRLDVSDFHADLFEEAEYGVGRLGTLAEPVGGAFLVNAERGFGRLARIVMTERLDVVAGPLFPGIHDDDAVMRRLFGANAHEANLDHLLHSLLLRLPHASTRRTQVVNSTISEGSPPAPALRTRGRRPVGFSGGPAARACPGRGPGRAADRPPASSFSSFPRSFS